MAMELKGKVIQLLPLQSGTSKKGQWKKQEFIVETPGQYPKKVCLSLWGDKVDQLSVSVGDEISAMVDLESREYNGRWYTEARVWKVDATGATSAPSMQSAPPPMDEPLNSDTSASTDDLPF
jgi:hypothetical protein